MLHLNITYHMHRNLGTASKPRMETAETCVTLAMEDHIAEDIMKNGSDSAHLSAASLGKVYLALAYISEIQGYFYSGFCTSDVVPMTDEDRAFIAKQNGTPIEATLLLEEDESRLEAVLQKYLIKRFGQYKSIPLFVLPQSELVALQSEVRALAAYRNGKFGRAIFDPYFDAEFGVAIAPSENFDFIIKLDLEDINELCAAVDALVRMREES